MLRPLLLLLLWLPAAAAESAGDDRDALLGQARALRDEANTVRGAAEQRHADARKACWEKVLVSACHDDATRALRAESDRARQLEQQAREIERQVKKRDFAEREARRLEEQPARDAAAAARAERNRQEMEEARRRVERKQAEAADR